MATCFVGSVSSLCSVDRFLIRTSIDEGSREASGPRQENSQVQSADEVAGAWSAAAEAIPGTTLQSRTAAKIARDIAGVLVAMSTPGSGRIVRRRA